MSHDFHAGQVFTERFRLDADVVRRFAEFSGDSNPLHMDAGEARQYGFPNAVAHGAIQVAYLSKLIGMVVPGPGALWTGHRLRWLRPVFVGEDITLRVEIVSWSAGASLLQLKFSAHNMKEEEVMNGEAEVKVGQKLAAAPRVEPGQPRVSLVTGASRGIGAEIARQLADRGPVAVHCHTNVAAAQAVADEIRAKGGEAAVFAADLSQPGAGTRLVGEAAAKFGRVEVLVHAATTPVPPVQLAQASPAQFATFWQVNVSAALELLHAAAPVMAAGKFGRVIFMGTSYLFGAPPAGMAGYISAKQALWGLARAAALELGPQGITVNMVSPSLTITDLSTHVPQRVKEVEAMKNPCRRLATPADSAAAIAWLASDAASFVNGVNLPVTGGPV
ncbi:MAG: SDR family oxidoreductase [Verrucomicrobiaceae bacterium]|nr:SDR family oxidoreductase [Verrucomicrobiaceae bacterium]